MTVWAGQRPFPTTGQLPIVQRYLRLECGLFVAFGLPERRPERSALGGGFRETAGPGERQPFSRARVHVAILYRILYSVLISSDGVGVMSCLFGLPSTYLLDLVGSEGTN